MRTEGNDQSSYNSSFLPLLLGARAYSITNTFFLVVVHTCGSVARRVECAFSPKEDRSNDDGQIEGESRNDLHMGRGRDYSFGENKC